MKGRAGGMLAALAAVILLGTFLLFRDMRQGVEVPGDVTRRTTDSARAAVPERDPAPEAAGADAIRETPASSFGRTALRVVGTVLDDVGRPIAGADIVVRLTHGDGPTFCRKRATSLEDGSYEVVLPEWSDLEETARSAMSLSGKASAFLLHAHRWIVADLSAARLGAPAVQLDLTVKPGAVVTGRVLRSDGRPSTGALVTLSIPGTGWRMPRRTNDAGEFVIPFHHERQHEISAMHSGQGLSHQLTLHLDPRSDSVAPDLVLHGSGFIEGMAVYADGSPAARLELEAELTPESAPVGRSGLSRGRTFSNDDGTFRFSGLAVGSYAIGYPGSSREPDCACDSVRTGTRDIKVTVRHHRVRVRVLDAEGEGVPGARIKYGFQIENRSSGSRTTISSLDGVIFIEGGSLSDEPDAWFQVDAWTEETICASASVPVEEGVFENRVDLVLRQPTEPGLLAINVNGVEGETIARFEVRLSSTEPPYREVSSLQAGPNGLPVVLRLPAGTYALSILPGGDDLFRYFYARSSVEIVAGQRAQAQVKLMPAARIRMRLHAARGDPAGRLSLRKFSVEPRNPVPAEHRDLVSRPLIDGRYLSAMKDHIRDDSTTDTPFTSMPTPALWPGWYRLHAEFSGYRPVDRDLFIRGKETTEVEIHLLREEH